MHPKILSMSQYCHNAKYQEHDISRLQHGSKLGKHYIHQMNWEETAAPIITSCHGSKHRYIRHTAGWWLQMDEVFRVNSNFGRSNRSRHCENAEAEEQNQYQNLASRKDRDENTFEHVFQLSKLIGAWALPIHRNRQRQSGLKTRPWGPSHFVASAWAFLRGSPMPNSAQAQLHQCLGRNLACLARISAALQLKGLFQFFHDRPDIRPLILKSCHCSYVVLPKPGPCLEVQEMDQAFARSINNNETASQAQSEKNKLCTLLAIFDVPFFLSLSLSRTLSLSLFSFFRSFLQSKKSEKVWKNQVTELDIPVVPHKAAAEVSKIGRPIGEVGCWESRMAQRVHWWTERWLELCFLEWLQSLQWSPGRSPHPQLLDVVWCSAAVVVAVA